MGDVGGDEAFLVSGAVMTPILGRLGDQYGKARMLQVSLALFVLGCLGASTAWSIWSLIAFRAVAGAGAALFPLSFAIIRDEFPPDKVKVGIGLLSAVFGVGSGFGIVLSGIVVDNLGWRYLFLFGFVPVTIAILLIRRYVPESPVRTKAPLDSRGALLLSAALVTLLLGLTEGESWGWTSGAWSGRSAWRPSCSPAGASSSGARAPRWWISGCSRSGRCSGRTSRR